MSSDTDDLLAGRDGRAERDGRDGRDSNEDFLADGGSGTGFSTAELLELLELPGLGALVTAGTVPPPPDELVAGALASVRAAAAVESGIEPAPARTATLVRRLRRHWMPAAVIVAAVATGASLLPVVDLGGTRPAASANAAAVFLNGVADQAARQKAQEAPYWKVTSQFSDARGPQPPLSHYISRSQTLFKINNAWAPLYVFTLPKGAPRGQRPVIPKDYKTFWPVGDQKITWDQLKTLPTDPAALAVRLRSPGFASSEAGCIENLLVNSPASPKLRAALFRVMAGLPGVRLDGTGKDRVGRTGTRVDFAEFRLLIDAHTGFILQSDSTDRQGRVSDFVYLYTGPAYKLE
ncbi:hypothetical protein GA0115240_144836 [Streptomyces sp. DvalAA-14]|uniref:hypothetical protein n=1 Tax=unclassified Streptomyces TaxID=2593676 RepID=UPI00081BBD56|nr:MULTISPECIES: hypothetical protein [unclassified Streptomyces]MYS22784.1 hypothetical protein [Streptomyces sp. SID4948]SCE22411.1 hypothetical protein GA0115240_144836 [Streptomyces sp. DvalAA-14]